MRFVVHPDCPHYIQSSPETLPDDDECLLDGDETWQGWGRQSMPIFHQDDSLPCDEGSSGDVGTDDTKPADQLPDTQQVADMLRQLDNINADLLRQQEVQDDTEPASLPDTQQLKILLEGTASPQDTDKLPSNAWASAVVSVLDSRQIENLMLRSTGGISYGDDCSGARAALEALKQFVDALSRKVDITIPIDDKFASEAPGKDGDGARAFIDVQCPPQIMFHTVHRGRSIFGQNVHTGKLERVPTSITIYTAGWVCRDISTMNQFPQPLLPSEHDKVCAGTAGASSLTLSSSLTYIEINRPDIAVLENLINKKNIEIATNAIKAMGGYSTVVVLADSRSFAVPMSRRRLYLLAVRTHLLASHLSELVVQLKTLVAKFHCAQFNDIGSGPLPLCIATAGSGPQSKVHARVRVAMATAPGDRCRKDRCRSDGRKDRRRKWMAQHDAIRCRLGLPSRKSVLHHTRSHSPLATSLPLRQQELLGLHWHVAQRQNVNPGKHHFVWDLTNSATFGCVKDPRLAGVVPCALRRHCLWDSMLGRPLSGIELMRVHGFCLKPEAAQLDDNVMKMLAGDTISIPPIGCVLALALANTVPPGCQNARPILLDDHHLPATWVGPSSWRGFDHSDDNLYKLAGLGKRKKVQPSKRKCTKRKRMTAQQLMGVTAVIHLD